MDQDPATTHLPTSCPPWLDSRRVPQSPCSERDCHAVLYFRHARCYLEEQSVEYAAIWQVLQGTEFSLQQRRLPRVMVQHQENSFYRIDAGCMKGNQPLGEGTLHRYKVFFFLVDTLEMVHFS